MHCHMFLLMKAFSVCAFLMVKRCEFHIVGAATENDLSAYNFSLVLGNASLLAFCPTITSSASANSDLVALGGIRRNMGTVQLPLDPAICDTSPLIGSEDNQGS